MKTIGLIFMLIAFTGCSESWNEEPFPELADIPDRPADTASMDEKRAIAAEMTEAAAEDEEGQAGDSGSGDEAAP